MAEDKEEAGQKKPSTGFSRRLRNFIAAALVAGGLSGVLIFKASQPNISKRTEEELRKIVAEGIASSGAGYFSMPITTEGVDYDGKLYSIKFHHNKGRVIERGREFIIPMSVEKGGRTYWYDIRVRDDQFVYMKRKDATFGGCSSIQKTKGSTQKIKESYSRKRAEKAFIEKSLKEEKRRIEKVRSAVEAAKAFNFWDCSFVPYSALPQLKANLEQFIENHYGTNEVKLLERMCQYGNEETIAAYWQILNEKDLELTWNIFPGDFNSDGKKDLAGLAYDVDKFNHWLIFLTSQDNGYKIDKFRKNTIEKEYMLAGGTSTTLDLIGFFKHELNTPDELKWLEKLDKEGKLMILERPSTTTGLKYCFSIVEEPFRVSPRERFKKRIGADWYYYKDGRYHRLSLFFNPDGMLKLMDDFPMCYSDLAEIYTPGKLVDELTSQR